MKKFTIAGLVSLFLLLAVVFLWAQENTQDLPPGVAPEKWIQLSKTAGIVMNVRRPPVIQKIYGTLMVKRGDTWKEVVLESSPGLHPVSN